MNCPEELARTVLLCRDYVAEDVTDQEICQRFQSLRILCVSDHRNLSSHAGQTALVTLVSLVSRMGAQVALDVPDLELLRPQPPLKGHSLPNALITLSEAFVRGATISTRTDTRPDIIFALGDSPFENYRAPCWRLSGDEWSAGISFDGVGVASAWKVEFTMGSMASAALAATEAFKHVLRGLRLRGRCEREFVRASRSSGWDFGSK